MQINLHHIDINRISGILIHRSKPVSISNRSARHQSKRSNTSIRCNSFKTVPFVSGTSTGSRNVVFTSKATPGDDEFVLWLAQRLKAAGTDLCKGYQAREFGAC